MNIIVYNSKGLKHIQDFFVLCFLGAKYYTRKYVYYMHIIICMHK